jgi:chromosome segregation ATPase
MRKNKSKTMTKKGGANSATLRKQTKATVEVLNEKNLEIKNLKAKIADLEEKIKDLQESETQSQGIIDKYEMDCNKLREENKRLQGKTH